MFSAGIGSDLLECTNSELPLLNQKQVRGEKAELLNTFTAFSIVSSLSAQTLFIKPHIAVISHDEGLYSAFDLPLIPPQALLLLILPRGETIGKWLVFSTSLCCRPFGGSRQKGKRWMDLRRSTEGFSGGSVWVVQTIKARVSSAADGSLSAEVCRLNAPAFLTTLCFCFLVGFDAADTFT